MHGGRRQRLERRGIDTGKVGAISQPVDGAAHFVRGARLFFLQCHASVAAAKVSFLSRSFKTVVFSHGKESGPWGAKITAMAAVVRDLELGVESVDYRGMEDPAERVKKLVSVGLELKEPAVLVGSSMGGHVAAAAASRIRARA